MSIYIVVLSARATFVVIVGQVGRVSGSEVAGFINRFRRSLCDLFLGYTVPAFDAERQVFNFEKFDGPP